MPCRLQTASGITLTATKSWRASSDEATASAFDEVRNSVCSRARIGRHQMQLSQRIRTIHLRPTHPQLDPKPLRR
jgi:hypothetical protein